LRNAGVRELFKAQSEPPSDPVSHLLFGTINFILVALVDGTSPLIDDRFFVDDYSVTIGLSHAHGTSLDKAMIAVVGLILDTQGTVILGRKLGQ
jgi:hypothetical protein